MGEGPDATHEGQGQGVIKEVLVGGRMSVVHGNNAAVDFRDILTCSPFGGSR